MTPRRVTQLQKRTTQPMRGYLLIRLFDSLVNVLNRAAGTQWVQSFGKGSIAGADGRRILMIHLIVEKHVSWELKMGKSVKNVSLKPHSI